MSNEIIRLKNDVLNELRNEKYYLQDDLRVVVENISYPQKEKVNRVIDIVSKLVNIDAKIATVDSIFYIQQTNDPIVTEIKNENKPTNVVEALNSRGQSHNE